MVRLSLIQKIHLIKRHMEQTTEETRPQKRSKRPIDENDTEITQEDPEPNIQANFLQENLNEIKSKLSPENLKKLQDHEDVRAAAYSGNATYDTLPVYEPLYVAPTLNTETLLTNVAYRTFVANVETVADKLNIEITKSTELAHEWQTHIIDLDKQIKALAGSWKTTLTYSACILTVLTFLWKMGAYRMIPDFATNLLNKGVAGAGNFATSTDLPAPSIKTTLNTIMDTPLTPIGVVFGVGAVSVGFSAFYILAMILRRLPK